MYCTNCKIEMWLKEFTSNTFRFECKKCGKEATQTLEQIEVKPVKEEVTNE